MKKHKKVTQIVINVRVGNGGRTVWSIDPVTRVVRNRKVYNRKDAKRNVRKEVREYV